MIQVDESHRYLDMSIRTEWMHFLPTDLSRQEVASGMPVEAVLHVRASLSLSMNFSTGGGSRSPELAVESCKGILFSKRVYRINRYPYLIFLRNLAVQPPMSPQTVAQGAAGRHRQPLP